VNPEVKELWLNALRSGEYAQGKGRLERINDEGVSEYCCLGVLCDLAAKAGITQRFDPPAETRVAYYGFNYDNFPPIMVWEGWAGLPRDNPMVTVPDPNNPELSRVYSLAELNDEQGYTFAQIADVVEAAL
jgi:hypothetical protein